MQKKAILYIRVSTDEQADKGYSLADQQDRLSKYCDINKIEIVSTFKEDHSAKTFERPTFKQMMAFAKKNKANIDYLLVIKWDRFSRNTKDSYQMIHEFYKLGIEVRAIEQHLDLNIPEAKLMLAFYLAAPEVENDRRALNVFTGMRRAKKEGRWVATAPLGYKNIRDENNKPIIVPDERTAPLIKQAFHELASGQSNIEQVRKRLYSQGLKSSRSNFNRLMRNPIYAGKIYIPAFKDEEEAHVEGRHEALIDEALFWEVQHILDGRTPDNKKRSKVKDELPLRGFLKCCRCGNILTGSASRGKLGGRYFYYHCREGCPERFKANLANESMVAFLRRISAKSEVIDLYYEILKDVFKESETTKDAKLKKVQEEIDKNSERINKAMQMMLDGGLDSAEYRIIKNRFEQLNIPLSREKAALESLDGNYLKYLKGGFAFLKNAEKFYLEATLENKQKIVGSMFTDNVIFENSELRTPALNEVVSLILQENNELEEIKNGIDSNNSNQSRLVVPTGIEPASKV